MTRKKLVHLLIGAAVAAPFLWLIFRRIDPQEIWRAVADADAGWIGAALLAFGVGYACRIERWRWMLLKTNPRLRWIDCAGPLLAGFAANNVLPLRAGDVLRSFAFNAHLGTTSGVMIATLFVERLLDLLMVLAVFGIALAMFGLDVARLAGVSGFLLLVAAAVIVFVLLYPAWFAPLLRRIGSWLARWFPRFGTKIADEIDKSLATLLHLSDGGRMGPLILWSVAAWAAEGCIFWFAALSLPSIAHPIAAWLTLPVAALATLVPSTPGYVGTFDYFAMQAMIALGNDMAAAAACAVLIHLLLWLPPTVLGGIYLLFRPVSHRETKTTGELA